MVLQDFVLSPRNPDIKKIPRRLLCYYLVATPLVMQDRVLLTQKKVL